MNRKKSMALFLSLMLIAGLLTGCGQQKETVPQTPDPAPAPAPAPAENDDSIHVSTLQELLDAIGPEAVITLEPGVYDIAPGEVPFSEYWYFGMDRELVITYVSDLTIRASEAGAAELRINNPYCAVLELEQCSNVVLEGLVMGHDVEKGQCAGNVLNLDHCDRITLNRMDLYGCGAYGVHADAVTGLQVNDSVIRECTYGIAEFYSSSGLSFNDCRFKDNNGYSMLWGSSCQAEFNRCTFSGNTLNESGDSFSCTGNSGSFIKMNSCSFGKDETEMIAMGEPDRAVVFDSSCTFDGDLTASTVRVNSVRQLLDSIGPGAVIYVEPGVYDLTDFIRTSNIDFFNQNHNFVSIDETYGGYEITVKYVQGLSIIGAGEDPADVELTSDWDYAHVLGFVSCTDVNLANMTMGHTVTGECYGPVVKYSYVYGAAISNMDLYGCGVEGFLAQESTCVAAYETTIRECSYGFATMWQDADTYADYQFIHCIFKDNEGGLYNDPITTVYFYNCMFGDDEINWNLYQSNVTVDYIGNYTAVYELDYYGEYLPDVEPEYFDFTYDLDPVPFDTDTFADTDWYAFTVTNSETWEGRYTETGEIFHLRFHADGTYAYDDSYGGSTAGSWAVFDAYSMQADQMDCCLYSMYGDEQDLYLWVKLGEEEFWMKQPEG
ncbi:MAG: right-handed parallel beta-helix repeat-containing protein [Firmicutes bacterium]|nr:right-handed parallel beta-helix repeat-containing protein [Bacillota bacterium]